MLKETPLSSLYQGLPQFGYDKSQRPKPAHDMKKTWRAKHVIYGTTRRAKNHLILVRKMAGAEGLEPSTYGFGDRRSTN